MERPKETLIQTIELFLQELNNEFSQYGHLQNNNVHLKQQIDTLLDENKNYQLSIESKNELISKLLDENAQLNKYQCEVLNDLKKDFISQNQVVEMKYQVSRVISI